MHKFVEKILHDLFDWSDSSDWKIGPNIYIDRSGTICIENDSKVVAKCWNPIWWNFITGKSIILPWV